MIRKSFQALITKIADESLGIVEAIVNVTGIEDFQKDLMEVGAWDDVIAKAQSGETAWPSVVWSHNWDLTTGKVLDAEELRPGDSRLKAFKGRPDIGGLRIVAQYNLDTQRGREAFSDVKFGAVKQWSVGFLTAKDGEHFDNKGIRHVTKVGVWPEVSNVLVGASPGTYTAIAKSAESSEDRLLAALEIEQRCLLEIGDGIEDKALDIPKLTGDEAIHNGPIAAALNAINTLIQQEAAERYPEFDCINRLSAIGLQLQAWARDEASEYSGDSMTATGQLSDEHTLKEAETAVEEKEEPQPEPVVQDPEPEFNLNDPDTWPTDPEYLLRILRELVQEPPQQSDPEPSGNELLTNYGRQNTRTGEQRIGRV